MKKVYLLFVAAVLAACSTESLETDNLDSLNAAMAGKEKASAATAVADVRSEWLFSNNGGLNQGKVTVTNDCDSVTLQFTELDGDPLTEVEFDLRTSLPALNKGGNLNETLSFSFADLDDNLSFTISFSDLGITHEDDLYIFAKAWGKWAGLSEHGNLNYFSYNVEEVACPGCEEFFTYDHNGNESYTFTYVPSEDMDNAEVTFTFPQGHVNVSPDLYAQNGEGNDTTFSTVLDLDACEAYNWTFELSVDCRGKGQKQANLWTDFTVDGESKKGELEIITQSCSE